MKPDYKGKDKDKQFIAYGFATNLPIKSKEAAKEIENMYRSRWGVEIFYKDSKNFFAKTTSNNSVIRDFYFCQSINIFNLWVLCNLILFVMYIKKYPDKPKIRMKTFATSLSEIQYKKRPPPEYH
jgi:IS4 transposase